MGIFGFALSFFLMTFAVASSASAKVSYPWEINTFVEVNFSVSGLATINSCHKYGEHYRPTCSELTDDLCQVLWAPGNEGKIQVSDGVIEMGDTGKSDMSAARAIDFKALFENESKMPADLRKKGASALKELKALLAQEKDTTRWNRSLEQAVRKWDEVVVDVASDRTEKRMPGLAAVSPKNYTVEQKAEYQKDQFALRNQILELKYAKHPNWKRVERVFAQAKADLITEISEMKIDEELKREMLQEAREVKLSLPYSDPNRLGTDASCGTYEKNASYYPALKTFTVCAGYFNSYRSDAALYGSIAHEISHAFDPSALAKERWFRNGKIKKKVEKLAGSKGNALSCEEWKQTVAEAKTVAAEFRNDFPTSIQPLYECIQSEKGLSKASSQLLDAAAERETKRKLSEYSTDHSLLNLAQPVLTKNGSSQPNELFMRPDRQRATVWGNTFVNIGERAPEVPELFVQALNCVSKETYAGPISYETSPLNDRSELFDNAIEETKAVLKGLHLEWYSYCGRNCPDLTVENLSVDRDENFADWMMIRSLNRNLSRKQNLRERREASALARVTMCEPPGPKKDAPDLAVKEKQYSLESHPDSRIRRISVFNSKNSDLVQCDVEQKDKGFGSCEL